MIKKILWCLACLLIISFAGAGSEFPGCSPEGADCSAACNNIFLAYQSSTWTYQGGSTPYCYTPTNIFVNSDARCDGYPIVSGDGECASRTVGGWPLTAYICPSAERKGAAVIPSDCICLYYSMSTPGGAPCDPSPVSSIFNFPHPFFQQAGYSVIQPSWPAGFRLTDTSGNTIGSSTTQTNLQIRKGINQIVAEFTINANVDLSAVTVDMDETAGKTVVSNLGTAPGVAGAYTLHAANVNSNGVYVCPGITSLSQVLANCQNKVGFTQTECQQGTPPKSVGTDLVTCTISGNDYKLSGLTSTGIGNNPLGGDEEQVPEFTSIGVFLLLISAFAVALIIIRKKQK
jgi:hypothetical protein